MDPLKKEYDPPVCEPVIFAAGDVIATSGDGEAYGNDIFDDEYRGGI